MADNINNSILSTSHLANAVYKKSLDSTVSNENHVNLGPIHIPKIFGWGVDNKKVQDAQQQFQQMQQQSADILSKIEDAINKTIAGAPGAYSGSQ
jgi:hypothetical protein